MFMNTYAHTKYNIWNSTVKENSDKANSFKNRNV